MNSIVYNGAKDASWDSDSFEDQISRSVIALYERPGNVKDAELPGLSEAELAACRERGVYVQHPSRMVFNDELDAPLDEIYQGLFLESSPHDAGYLNRCVEKIPHLAEVARKSAFASFTLLKRAPSAPFPYRRTSPGTLYCLAHIDVSDDGEMETWKEYFTVKGKRIAACALQGFGKPLWNYQHRPPILDGLSLAEDLVKRATTTANTISDRRHQWGIIAAESKVKVDMQCYHEEVKSLLYARSLPITSTGRKRPILHLVAAHRRRMREGIDIEIATFLRGVRKVEMGGAVFEVRAPLASGVKA